MAFEFDLGMNFCRDIKFVFKIHFETSGQFQNKHPLVPVTASRTGVLPCRFRAGGAGTLKRGLLRPTVPVPVSHLPPTLGEESKAEAASLVLVSVLWAFGLAHAHYLTAQRGSAWRFTVVIFPVVAAR